MNHVIDEMLNKYQAEGLADKKNANFVAVIGDSELESGLIALRSMKGEDSREIALDADTIARAVKNK